MLPFYRKYWRTALDIALIVLTVYLVMFSFSYLYKIATPVFLAFVIYWIIEPLARFLNRRKIKKSIATGISMLIFVVVLLSIIGGASAIFIMQVTALAMKLPDYAQILQQQFILHADDIRLRIDALPAGFTDKAIEYLGFVADKGALLGGWVLTKLVGFISSTSTFVIIFAIAVILAYFLSVEIETWKKVARTKTPKTFKLAFTFLRENVLKGIGTYVKAQLKLITITFIIIFGALLALRVENGFSIALLAALFDLLPLLGVSTVFIPWIVYLFITGNTVLALWLSGLLLVVILMRQILEPKITGDSLGVSAFTMLVFMIISLSLFGIAGLILSPILIILIKALYEQGYLRRWIRLPAEEYEEEDKAGESGTVAEQLDKS